MSRDAAKEFLRRLVEAAARELDEEIRAMAEVWTLWLVSSLGPVYRLSWPGLPPPIFQEGIPPPLPSLVEALEDGPLPSFRVARLRRYSASRALREAWYREEVRG